MSLNIIFAGTPDFAAQHLKALIQAKYTIKAVLTQPDKPAGRGQKLQPSPVKQVALEHGLTVLQPRTLKKIEIVETLKTFQADVLVVVAYGLILPASVLALPKYGCINVHASLLPRWRGAAPIQYAIWKGDKETGITIMQMDEGLDTGPMLHKVSCNIDKHETSASLYQKLAQQGPEALIQVLNGLALEKIHPIKQNDAEATHAGKIEKKQGLIIWEKETAEEIDYKIRAFNPWPMAYFADRGQMVKVWEASVTSLQGEPGKILDIGKNSVTIATKQGALILQKIQLPNGKPLAVRDLFNGNKLSWTLGYQFESCNE